jgi:hypothetical protein
MATALPITAGLSKGWCGLHNASPWANYLPSRTLNSTRCQRKVEKIINNPTKAGTERLKNSFYLKANRLLNTHH